MTRFCFFLRTGPRMNKFTIYLSALRNQLNNKPVLLLAVLNSNNRFSEACFFIVMFRAKFQGQGFRASEEFREAPKTFF